MLAAAPSCSGGTKVDVGGPLRTLGNGTLLNKFNDVQPGKPNSLAAVLLYNSGRANIVLEGVSVVGRHGVTILGAGVADARLRWMTETHPATVLIPGTYDLYPPTDEQGHPVRILSASETPPLPPAREVNPAPDPAEMIVIGMSLDAGTQIGWVLGVQVRYRVASGGEFSRFLGYPAILCRGSGPACDAAAKEAFAEVQKLVTP